MNRDRTGSLASVAADIGPYSIVYRFYKISKDIPNTGHTRRLCFNKKIEFSGSKRTISSRNLSDRVVKTSDELFAEGDAGSEDVKSTKLQYDTEPDSSCKDYRNANSKTPGQENELESAHGSKERPV